MGKKRVKFMCTAFRDGFQSVYGARVLTEDFMPAVAAAREAGIDWMESGGGALFQSSFFYCNENAFTMMDRFRETAGPDANLQTLARGINVVGLESQPSDVIKLHAVLFKKHGVTTVRNFDALNDVDNLIYSGQCIHEAGLKHQVCVTMMELPPGLQGAHDPDYYEQALRRILDADIPYDSVSFKDSTGTSTPANVYETIRRARKLLPEGAFIHYHTHDTAGIGVLCYKAALEAGADAIDLSLAPVSGGTCQPDVVIMWHALRGTEYDLGIDVDKVLEAEKVLKECMKDYFMPPEATMVEPMIPWSPMPGGALTVNTQMLRDNGIMDKYTDIIQAMGEVVRRGGFGTSVTPVSQFYFQQAFNNVMFGPWKKIAEGYGKMVLGYFGRTPVAPDPEVVRLAAEQMKIEPTTKTPLELNDADPSKGLRAALKMLKEAGLEESYENLFIAASCREKGIAFLKGEAKVNIRKIKKTVSLPAITGAPAEQPAPAEKTSPPADYTVMVNGKPYTVKMEGQDAFINGKRYSVKVTEGLREAAAAAVPAQASTAAPTGDAVKIVKAPLPGTIFKLHCRAGDSVSEGDELLVLEAMKMEVPVRAHASGSILSVGVKAGDMVATGQILVTIS
ncbi:MAG TPA: biotin/lipoyl-containing protein [Acidobacteriota bacterium]|nr:biotin/lipoyl-containing protein [Acidobacteriota bacterium]